MEKGNQIRKRKKEEENHNVPHTRKGRTMGPVVASMMEKAETTERTSRTQKGKAERREGRLQACGLIG
jgi:hypothetical protein